MIFTTDLATRLSAAGGRTTADLLDDAFAVVLDEPGAQTSSRRLSADVVDLHITFERATEAEAVEVGRRIRTAVGAGVMAGSTRRRYDLERLVAVLA